MRRSRNTEDLLPLDQELEKTLRQKRKEKKMADEKELIAKMKEKFLHGAVERQMPLEIADTLWHQMEAHSGYSFNLAHSVEYAYITYITAWLKLYYPVQFMAACLSVSQNDIETARYLNECKRLKIGISLPDVKKSGEDFLPYGNNVLYSIYSIKNSGDKMLEKILAWQQTKNLTLISFMEFVKPNKKITEILIRSGAFDCLNKDGMTTGEYRGKLLHDMLSNKFMESLQYSTDLFGNTIQSDNLWTPLSDSEMLLDEKNYLGIFITRNPLDEYAEHIGSRYTLLDINAATSDICSIIGIINKITIKYDKRGNEMAIIDLLQYDSTTINIIVFSKQWKDFREKLTENMILTIKGSIRNQGNFITEQILGYEKI
jgi:DNA polymerase-3 subunit alpha